MQQPGELRLRRRQHAGQGATPAPQHATGRAQSGRMRRLHTALLLAAVLQLVVVWPNIISMASAQPVKLVSGPGNEGCLQKQPDPPANVKATERDGKVLLTWDRPPDGSCVDTYVIDCFDPELRSTSSVPLLSSSTDATSFTVDGLQNGRTYAIRVQAFSSLARSSGSADITATPSARCESIPPERIIGLRVTPGAGLAQVCWDGVDNDACVDEYRVSSSRVDDTAFRGTSDATISRGGCANISRLQDGQQYKFNVLAASTAYGEGPVASTTAFVGAAAASQNGWRCKLMKGCRPGGVSLCSAVGCQGMQRWGGCKGPAMYDIDYLRRQVTQWCSDACTCDLSVAATFTPLSWGFAVGLMDSASALLGLDRQSPSSGNLLPGMIQGAASGVADALGQGQSLGDGLIATAAGKMLQSSLGGSSDLGQRVADQMGAATGKMVSSMVQNVVDGAVASFSQPRTQQQSQGG